MSAGERAHRARSNYSDEKKEELRRINRDRARQRRAQMTEEEKQQVRVRQRLNTRKKREAERQKQKELREESYSSQSQGHNFVKQGGSMANSLPPSSSLPGPLSIPHPQAFGIPRSQHHQSQSGMQLSGQWNANQLNSVMSQPQIPLSYQRPGQIYPDPNSHIIPQSSYSQQNYNMNEFNVNDVTQMPGQLKTTMNVLDDCVRRLTLLEKEVQNWKSKFEGEADRRRTMEEWVLEKFGVDLQVRFPRSDPPAKPRATANRPKRRRKPKESVDRFPSQETTAARIPSTTTAGNADNMWSLDSVAAHTALNLESVAYNALNVSNNIPPFNVSKEEIVDLYSSTINPSSSIISYK